MIWTYRCTVKLDAAGLARSMVIRAEGLAGGRLVWTRRTASGRSFQPQAYRRTDNGLLVVPSRRLRVAIKPGRRARCKQPKRGQRGQIIPLDTLIEAVSKGRRGEWWPPSEWSHRARLLYIEALPQTVAESDGLFAGWDWHWYWCGRIGAPVEPLRAKLASERPFSRRKARTQRGSQRAST
ncbi:hypothetical protein K490DRAFT_58645 [Saccharata proteae CBS 121410]|uniref:Uncharacterized protein n=1 Tax=Saccharata proteae CBS 121410 TaxID=1314787 RepID=A0A9P4LVM0_9PEZI|nr:hypothetical protein K490DRAFT_58645 [Saccharata proteae CBS 121410]